MGKTIRLTEEQIMRFFGPGFGRKLIGEGKKKEPASEDKLKAASERYNKGHKYANGDRGDGDYYYTGQHNISREGKDLPGYGGAVAKMASFGAANLTRENAINSNELLDAIRSVHSGPLNIIDALQIMHQIKNGTADLSRVKNKNGEQLTNEEALSFLNGLNIDYILSNFISLNAPDYVFFRLKNLSEQEIQHIYDTYGRNFENFGQRCDGCGASKWKTTVIPNEHDDAHINFEYMGSAAATNTTDHALTEEARKVSEYLLPFQIHHMNENPGDNSPLNLSCLCPNCHAITGSYGKRKRDFSPEDFKILEANTTVDDGSLMGLLSKEEQDKIAGAIKKGEFGRSDITNNMLGVNLTDELDPSDTTLLGNIEKFGVENPEQFVVDFNREFNNIFNKGKEFYLYANGLGEKPKLNEEVDQQDNDEKESGDTKGSSTFILDGIKFYYKLDVTKSGNVCLELYADNPPFVFSAFKSNNISLTPMYFEDEYQSEAVNDIRNLVLKSALLSIKKIRDGEEGIDDYSVSGPSWTRKNDGDTVMSRFRNIKPGSEEGRRAAKALYATKGSSADLAMGRELKAKTQPRQKLSISGTELDNLYNRRQLPIERLSGVEKAYGSEMVNALVDAKNNNLSYNDFIDDLINRGLLTYK